MPPGLGGIDPDVRLLGGDGEIVLLHVDEGIDAAAEQIGHGGEGRRFAGSLFDAGHDELILTLSQLQENALGGEEVGQAFAGHFG